jgi:phosphoribosylglycinamide formyltransferase-1
VRAVKWGALISGRGSNLGALLDFRRESEGLFELALVVSSRAEAQGLCRARREGVPTMLLPREPLLPRRIDWNALSDRFRERGVTRLFLVGFMRIVAAEFCRDWSGRIVNLHPSLLPAYPGLESIRRAHEDGAPMGATVHFVAPEVDAGAELVQRVSLTSAAAAPISLEAAEFSVHLTEQRLVRAAMCQASQAAGRSRAGQGADLSSTSTPTPTSGAQ